MLFPLIAVGLFFIWIGFVVVDMLGGKLSWPGQQASNLTTFFDSHRITTTLFIICIALAIRGHYVTHGENSSLDAFAADFYGNYFAEILGIGATVFLIDRINRRRDQEREVKAEKERLIAEMGSTNNDVALLAVRKLRQLGWLKDGTLKGMDFSQANLSKATLMSADLTGADLMSADLTGANLSGANLSGVKLWGTKLRGTDLMIADLTGADLMIADLTGANLSGAKLRGAKLRGADLTGANLFGADLTGVTLFSAIYNRETLWPDGFDPQAAGAIEQLSTGYDPDDQHDQHTEQQARQ